MQFHPFDNPVLPIALPERFTYPFHYTPHPLCIMAAEKVQAYLESQEQWNRELAEGKMFGVLVVQTVTGDLGFLAAFSGILAGKNLHPYFVPPVYDLLQPEGFFKSEEENISAINARIRQLETDKNYQASQEKLALTNRLANQALSEAKIKLKAAKEAREIRRKNHPDISEQEAMIRESQYQKAEFKRLERHWKESVSIAAMETDAYLRQIETLKAERKKRSAMLQQRLFEQFRLLNARGETKNLCDIFEQTAQKTPPAGAGECAAPKLLQYAYLNELKPIAMAEFWWGQSPKAEIRHHGYFYPACQGKCGPILAHMLQGLQVEDNPLATTSDKETTLEILYEDNWLLVINKPAGMLTVPGKMKADSVYTYLKRLYPEATGPMIVHRLDMATSGLLLVAKTKEIHQNLQAQFKNRTIKKRYCALLDGVVNADKGTIDLPLCLNPLDRPRQIVSGEHGKPAITYYEVRERYPTRTRIAFYPLTGRTHQLRVHASHPSGLNCPITGDELYGKKAERLYLHAEYLEFRHPVSGESICIEKEAGF